MAITRHELCWHFQCTRGSDKKVIPGKYFPSRPMTREQAIDVICTLLVRRRAHYVQKYGGLIFDPHSVLLIVDEPATEKH